MSSKRTDHKPPIPRTPTAARRLGYKNQTQMKNPLRGLKDETRKVIMVTLDARTGRAARYCHWDPEKGVWICSDDAE